MLSFPTITPATNGQTLGAAQLNAYKRALEHLLGESHAPMPLALPLYETMSYWPAWVTMWDGYMLHWADSLYYLIRLANQGSGQVAHARLIYIGDDGQTHIAAELGHVDNNWTAHSGTVDLSGAASMTKGRPYLWRWQIRTDQDTYNTCLQVWATSERGILTGWSTPPTFGAGPSDAAPLNVVRSNLNALYNTRVSPVAPLQRAHPGIWENALEHWYDAGNAAWRYRPSQLYVRLQLTASYRADIKWRIRVGDTAGRWASIYESGQIHVEVRQWAELTIDMSAPAVQQALTAAGIALVPGNYYCVTVGMKKVVDNPDAFGFDNLFLCRLSTQVPAAGWAVPRRFVHGDTGISPASLNAYSTDLTALAPGGAEELWGEITPCQTAGQWEMYGYHRKRWLCYLHTEDGRPQLHHGANLASSMDLPTGSGWQNYDLAQVPGLAWGGLMYVSGCTAAFECDTVVL